MKNKFELYQSVKLNKDLICEQSGKTLTKGTGGIVLEIVGNGEKYEYLIETSTQRFILQYIAEDDLESI